MSFFRSGKSLDPERLVLVEETYHAVSNLPGPEREAVLEQRCAGDPELRLEVVSLLAMEDTAGPLETPVLELAAALLDNPSSPPLVPGAKAGPYEILERIGGGGMGEVFRARDTRLGRTVALKVVHAHFSDHSLREARAIAALNHPRICTLYDIGENYLVLELLDGETLAQRLARGPLPPAEALRCGAQIADALWCAHSKGIVHGDLKPGNLMCTKSGIKVLDFGVARFEAAGETSVPTPGRPALGTPAYLAPEQIQGGAVDHRSDIFALGLILFEMAAGARPFAGETREALARSVLNTDAQVGRLSPPAFAHIVERCLEKDPEDRWQSARDLQLELDYAARALPVVSAAPSKLRWWWLAFACMVVLLVLAAFQFSRGAPELSVLPLTSYPGSETGPSFSPDGSRVAFSWDGPREENRDIYVRQIGPGNPIRLTSDPADDVSPRWSPDGNWIAFLRQEPNRSVGVYIIPALGGMERRLGASAARGRHRYCLDWSKDGQWLVFSTADSESSGAGLALLAIETGAIRRLTSPDSPNLDTAARFSPGGDAIAFLRTGEGLMVLALSPDLSARGLPRRIHADVTGPVQSVSWSADGRDLILAAGYGSDSSLWRVPVSGSSRAARLTFGEAAVESDVAAAGGRLVFSRLDGESHIWSLEFDHSGRVTSAAVKSFESSRSELSPAFSPEGSRVAFGSNRSGSDEIWVCRSDSSDCSQLTSFKGTHPGSPAWSPDGQWILFDVSRADGWEVDVIRASGGKPRRLAAGMLPKWSRDGQRIYYQCGAQFQICQMPFPSGEPVKLGEGFMPRESPDGKWLYYLAKPTESHGAFEVRRKSLTDADAADEVLPVITGFDYTVSPDGVWFVPPAPPREGNLLSFYDLASRTVRAVYQTPKPVKAGLSLSPDGGRLLFTQLERPPNLDLMLVEKFR